ncbi:sortase-associated OmpA-like protein PdsO [Shewanella sp. SHSM-M6]|uniref:Sortase-associated OmpA-like protein PdsO n=2 Tax=Shewanella salipaludis TaxID=2723052 RepID=A0A972JJ63_9GAMM|nr:sortase-associated OmpA-like protein PdsO [Shewanella salipaludis]
MQQAPAESGQIASATIAPRAFKRRLLPLLVSVGVATGLGFSGQSLAGTGVSAAERQEKALGHEEQGQEKEQGHEELIGIGSGIVLGAVVGGPVGAIIGAFTGGILGKSVGDDEELARKQTRLAAQENELAALRQEQAALTATAQEYDQAQRQLSALKQAQQQLLAELALGLNVQFRTGSSVIEPHFARQLDYVADTMALAPELRLDLTGYADRRGDADYNQALSEQRLAEVKSYLVQRGVAKDRLNAQAYGASSPLNETQDRETDVFDRRVTLKLQARDTELAKAAGH